MSAPSTIKKNYVYHGFGFPINLGNVRTRPFEDTFIVDVDFQEIENVMAHIVPLKPHPLTGAEIKFLRRHLDLTQQQFAEMLGVSRQSVISWEKSVAGKTGISPDTEKLMRIHVLRRLGVKSDLLEDSLDKILTEGSRAVAYKLDTRRKLAPDAQMKNFLRQIA